MQKSLFFLYTPLVLAFLATEGRCSGTSIMPSAFAGDTVASSQHPLAAQINGFIKDQASSTGPFSPTGLTRTDYLRSIEKIARAMLKYQNSNGQIIDPVIGREHQYATPCFAHAVAVLCGSGFINDATLLQAGIKAMDASIGHMLRDDVPDSHGDFFTVPMMLAFWNFKNVVAASKISSWRTDLGRINPSAVYINAAPNWIGINMTGEFLRSVEGLTSISYTTSRILYQITRMGKEGLYQDSDRPETTSVSNSTDGNSIAYDNVARCMLNIVAINGYEGTHYQELRLRLCRGAWTGLLYQSPFGEVPTGMRSSHHFWNEAYAAVNYEIWAAQYARAGKPEIAGAFKRAAMLSLSCVQSWHRSDGSGYVTKARYPIESKWGYMKYSGHTQYNLWTASAMAMAWQYGDSTIEERPAPCDIGGFVCKVLPGFKKVFANAGGTYVEYDVRGDHAHNPTGLLRLHLKTGYPQLGPSDGAVGQVISGAQYWPLYPQSDPPGQQNLSVGPAWMQSGSWYPLAEMQQIPQVAILDETPEKSVYRLVYSLSGGATLHETVMVEPRGVTVTDSLAGGNHSAIRAYYPMLRTDGEEQSQITVNGNQVIVRLRDKGVRFMVRRPANALLVRTNVLRNHRNGRCEAIYAEVQGRVVESYVSAWPEYDPTGIAGERDTHKQTMPPNRRNVLSAGFALPATMSGPYTFVYYSLQGREVAIGRGNVSNGMLNPAPVAMAKPSGSGLYRAVFTCGRIKACGMVLVTGKRR
ncbi:MAG: hypothetical protein JW768_12155 [Chitinispirillaceae bacterium]|nr:hypothetical protein [Chitinispirillaceae bacterium]